MLDAFADRIGDSTWRTIITEDGLLAVKKLLRKTATKNTAVACHWIRSRSRSELVWIVGNRNKFNKEGVVPVNSTQQNLQHSEWENDWEYLPQIKALTAIAALLHDWGKASVLFQKKLKSSSRHGDPLRHEWISCVILHALILYSGNLSDDSGWLNLLHNWSFDEDKVVEIAQQKREKILEQLPPIAQMIAWLILSHHRLPSLYEQGKKDGFANIQRTDFSSALESIHEDWGYKNGNNDDFSSNVPKCFKFQFGLLKNSAVLAKQAKKWAGRLITERENVCRLFQNNSSLRLVLQYARLCLMLSDHYISSLEAENLWNGNKDLFANTDNKHNLKQRLDEHLVRVSAQALKVSQHLTWFAEKMEKAYDVKALKQKSPPQFAWQDNAVDKIKQFRNEHHLANSRDHGWFIVNMASTGCGKTVANAKIMQAISEDGDGLRYILALGLRTLTLQTGDEYRERIGLNSDELAILIGSSAIKELHEQKTESKDKSEINDCWSESLESLLDEDLDFADGPLADFLDDFFPQDTRNAKKNKAFLYKPVLACTIDHIIAATETIKGGKYILPFLRLMSSDLVIDEIDEFDKKDLTAISRLIHLAGMLGRSVALSSATIPPGLAEGLYNAYQEGWECYRSFYHKDKQPICVWCDEFGAKVESLQGVTTSDRCRNYAKLHENFATKRAERLARQIVKRKAYIACCQKLLSTLAGEPDENKIEQHYFEIIKDTAKQLHAVHCFVDFKTGKHISFGVVRVANIHPCAALGRYLIDTDWGNDFAPKVMVYHSHQVLLLRHEQEQHLDAVLKRKEKSGEEPLALNNPIIRNHIDTAQGNNVLFILVATPVEEVGRDHDFDWAIIEPSSFRSIIQLAGRVVRHRALSADIAEPNIAIMQYNIRGLKQDGKPAFCRPGYETRDTYKLFTHDMTQLVDGTALRKGINAIPRIIRPDPINPHGKLADLEHAVMDDFKDVSNKGPAGLEGWLTGYWWITALPQQFNHFRDSTPEVKLYLLWKEDEAVFYERTEQGEFVERERLYNIRHAAEEPEQKSRYWLTRDYSQALQRQLNYTIAADVEDNSKEMYAISQKFGEVNIRLSSVGKELIYSDQFGLLEKK